MRAVQRIDYAVHMMQRQGMQDAIILTPFPCFQQRLNLCRQVAVRVEGACISTHVKKSSRMSDAALASLDPRQPRGSFLQACILRPSKYEPNKEAYVRSDLRQAAPGSEQHRQDLQAGHCSVDRLTQVLHTFWAASCPAGVYNQSIILRTPII